MDNQNHELEEGQIVQCIVDKILGTTIFLRINGGGEGTMTTSEVSPGRIRNLRDYVVPGKKIVCKILRIDGNRIYLSLRRVTQSEKKELLDKINKERSYTAILKTVLGKEGSVGIINKIREDYAIIDFFEELKIDNKLIEKYVDKKDSEKIVKILESKKEKPKELRQIFHLSSKSPEGIKIVKEIIQGACQKSCNTLYLAAGRYRITLIGEDFKKLKTELGETLRVIEKTAKKKGCEFSIEK
jgi:translation initiation factor 2 subunit 1